MVKDLLGRGLRGFGFGWLLAEPLAFWLGGREIEAGNVVFGLVFLFIGIILEDYQALKRKNQ